MFGSFNRLSFRGRLLGGLTVASNTFVRPGAFEFETLVDQM